MHHVDQAKPMLLHNTSVITLQFADFTPLTANIVTAMSWQQLAGNIWHNFISFDVDLYRILRRVKCD